MKIAIGWGTKDRNPLVGAGQRAHHRTALPHLAAYLGGADWRAVIVATSALAFIGGLLVMGTGLARITRGRPVSTPARFPCMDRPAHPPHLSRLLRA
jgi:hypothetical protein